MSDNLPTTRISVAEVLKMDPAKDPNNLLGKRFLCRGSGGVIFGPSGIGKSSFALQFACHLAIGESFFGIKNLDGDPLKILLVQAENDAYEVAEVLKSVTLGWDAAKLDALNKNLFIECLWNKSHLGFADWLADQAKLQPFDIAIVDPLMSYAGSDAVSNKEMTNFLRNLINPKLKSLRENGLMSFGLIFIHHTGKPSRPTSRTTKEAASSYDMFGASELINWARFVIHLDVDPDSDKQKDSDKIYRLSITKRGNRSGLHTHSNAGESCCYLKHAPQDSAKVVKSKAGLTNVGRIHWERCSDAEAASGSSATNCSEDHKEKLSTKKKTAKSGAEKKNVVKAPTKLATPKIAETKGNGL